MLAIPNAKPPKAGARFQFVSAKLVNFREIRATFLIFSQIQSKI